MSNEQKVLRDEIIPVDTSIMSEEELKEFKLKYEKLKRYNKPKPILTEQEITEFESRYKLP